MQLHFCNVIPIVLLKSRSIERQISFVFIVYSAFTFPVMKQGAPFCAHYQWLIALIANYFNAW